MSSVSWRVSGDAFLFASVAEREPEGVAFFDLGRKNLGPDIALGPDFDLHREIYKARSDLAAIVHAQPVSATVLAAAGRGPTVSLTQETFLGLGDVGVIDYQPRGTCQLSEAAVAGLGDYGRVLFVRGLGVLTASDSLRNAVDLMSLAEMASQMTLTAATLGREITGLSPAEQRAASEV